MVENHPLLPLRPGYFRILPCLAQLARTEKLRVSFTGFRLGNQLVKGCKRVRDGVHAPSPSDLSLACASCA